VKREKERVRLGGVWFRWIAGIWRVMRWVQRSWRVSEDVVASSWFENTSRSSSMSTELAGKTGFASIVGAMLPQHHSSSRGRICSTYQTRWVPLCILTVLPS
jgi:hypothetical protein